MSYSSRPPPPPPTGISAPDSRSQNSNVRIMNPIGETDSSGGIIHGFMQRMSTGSSEVASNSSGIAVSYMLIANRALREITRKDGY